MRFIHCLAAVLIVLCAACKKENTVVFKDAVWSAAPHNAFTDLVYYRSKYYCAFREATSHTSLDGKIRILTSADGNTWQNFALLDYNSRDMRDPYFFIGKDSVLSLTSFARSKKPPSNNVVFKLEGNEFSSPAILDVDNDFWLWRYMAFHNNNYSIGYNTQKKSTKPSIILYSNDSTNLNKYDILNNALINIGCPTEAALCVSATDSIAYTIVRDDCTGTKCFLGISKYPFANWSWKGLPFFVRGPNLQLLSNGKLFLVASAMTEWNKTSYTIIDPKTFAFQDIKDLISDGDNGYPGVVIKNNEAMISYYSSHEGKACIYIKKVNL